MSIIEETLRNLEEGEKKEGVYQDLPHSQVKEQDSPTDIKPVRSRKFVVVLIYLTLFGLGAYYGLDRYQESINKKKEGLNYKAVSLNSLANSITVSKKDVASHENIGVIDSDQETQVTSVDETTMVEPNQKENVVDQEIPETSVQGNLITEQTVGPHLSGDQDIESPQNDVSLAGSVETIVSNQNTNAAIVSTETKPKQKLETEVHPAIVNQSYTNQLSVEPAEDLTQSEEKTASSLLEENIFGKKLKQARHLINIGSYSEAIDILKPIIDRQEETWDTYLLIGAAYLGLGELDYAETYSEMGLAMNGKVPQLWLQCAIIEQERGKHEAALRILNESERFAPDMPEVQLNIGYSYDAVGNQRLSAKAYNAFLELTEGDQAYMMLRYKVLDRLRNLN
ncbi:MAG: tetratricopeptide repeat protein [Candidatus Brocadiaceae bacterium]|nr:tetratricopeptide repeat protein [Candidatus Brocadiaceae bacterium]